MTDSDLAKQLVSILHRPDGSMALRPVHSLGIAAKGYFQASDVAGNFCRAAHFADPLARIPALVRFSNGSGAAQRHDGWSDVRGMATRFFLPDGSATDLVAMTLNCFFSPTPEDFLAFAKAAKPTPIQRQSPWTKLAEMLSLVHPPRNPYPDEDLSPDAGAIAFADSHASAQAAVFAAAGIGAPVSYARAAYHAVHSFVVTAPDGQRRTVRFQWQPIAGVLNTDPDAPVVDDYLDGELCRRLADGPARFSLMMAIAELGDAVDDPSIAWPPHRRRIQMGTLTLTELCPDQEADSEKISFNPHLLTDGVEASGDPVLHIRKEAYETSSKIRGATPCPFGKRG